MLLLGVCHDCAVRANLHLYQRAKKCCYKMAERRGKNMFERWSRGAEGNRRWRSKKNILDHWRAKNCSRDEWICVLERWTNEKERGRALKSDEGRLRYWSNVIYIRALVLMSITVYPPPWPPLKLTRVYFGSRSFSPTVSSLQILLRISLPSPSPIS